jgi:Ca2+-transporting ATPase
MVAASLGLGTAALLAVMLVYGWALLAGRSEGEMRALAFAAIVIGNLALIFAHRSRSQPILATLARPNPVLWWMTLAALTALGVAIYLPPVAAVFRFAPLDAAEIGVALAAGLAGALWSEGRKWRANRHRGTWAR